MTEPTYRLARRLAALAAAVAPPERADWARAMRGELAEIEAGGGGGGGGLAWALGGLGAALGWRLRAEAAFLLTAAALLGGAYWLGLNALFLLEPRLPDGAWMEPLSWIQLALLGLPVFLLCLWKPRRALATAVVCGLLSEHLLSSVGFLMLVAERERQGRAPAGAVRFFIEQDLIHAWPLPVGALAGWLIGRALIRRRGAA